MCLVYVWDRGALWSLTVAPFKINGLMKTVCLLPTAGLSISQRQQRRCAELTKKNTRDGLRIHVTSWDGLNDCGFSGVYAQEAVK